MPRHQNCAVGPGGKSQGPVNIIAFLTAAAFSETLNISLVSLLSGFNCTIHLIFWNLEEPVWLKGSLEIIFGQFCLLSFSEI